MSPGVLVASPSRGAGTNQTFSFSFTDTRGYQDLGIVDIIVNDALDGAHACYLAYSRPLNVLYLLNDAGTTLLQGIQPGGPGIVANSQCSVNGALSSVTVGGTTLTLNLNLSFTPSFSGNQIIFLAARDITDANNSGWQASGTWTVQ
jgi:hypothetical protein